MVSGLMKSVMSENQNNWSRVLATTLRYLRIKPGKRGLNSPFTCPEWGGVLTHYLTVTGSKRSTRYSRRVITLRPGALLEVSFLFLNSSAPIKSIHYLFDWGRRYGQVRFPAIHLFPISWHLHFSFRIRIAENTPTFLFTIHIMKVLRQSPMRIHDVVGKSAVYYSHHEGA
jgi:hypothetical protein